MSENNVTREIPATQVEAGFWDTDANAQYAVLMDREDGSQVWHRSNDWRLYGRMHGWDRVARIVEAVEVPGVERDDATAFDYTLRFHVRTLDKGLTLATFATERDVLNWLIDVEDKDLVVVVDTKYQTQCDGWDFILRY